MLRPTQLLIKPVDFAADLVNLSGDLAMICIDLLLQLADHLVHLGAEGSAERVDLGRDAMQPDLYSCRTISLRASPQKASFVYYDRKAIK